MRNEAQKLLDAFRAKCREKNLKITPQRTAIYEVLLNNQSHPAADAVFEKVKAKIPNISFDTVNRTLMFFAGMGLLKVVEGYGQPKRFDPDIVPHHHFQCLRCHAIVDFSDPGFDAIEVPKTIQKKFTVTGKKVVLEGFCGFCRK